MLNELASGADASGFVSILMRKLFTEDYLSTKSFNKMEKEYQDAIFGNYCVQQA